jgi:nicotinate-nucleotide adenylyltransferase
VPERPERVGVFGGTFDPIHNGHLAVSAHVRYALALDRLLLVVAHRPWQKRGRAVLTDAAVRLAMVEKAVEGVDGVEASSLEIDRGGDSVTAETLEELAAALSGVELYLVVGSDVAAELDTWRRVDVVRALATLVLVDRPGAMRPALPGWRVEHVEVPQLAISSTELRARTQAGLPLDGLVPPAVVRLIKERGLYAEIG